MKNANTTIEDEQKFDEALAEADFSESIKSGAWIKGRRGRPKIGDKHAVILPPELTEEVKRAAEKRAIGYQTMLRIIVKENIKDYI